MFEKIPESWLPVIKSVASSLVLVLVVLLFYLILTRGIRHAERKKKINTALASLARILLRWTAVVFALLFVLGQLGILENVWAALVAVLAMVAVGFVAVWSVLSNTLCTFFILVYKPFQIGDLVEIPADSLKGKVVDLNLLLTTLREEDGALVHLPNNTFFQKATRRHPGGEKFDAPRNTESDGG